MLNIFPRFIKILGQIYRTFYAARERSNTNRVLLYCCREKLLEAIHLSHDFCENSDGRLYELLILFSIQIKKNLNTKFKFIFFLVISRTLSARLNPIFSRIFPHSGTANFAQPLLPAALRSLYVYKTFNYSRIAVCDPFDVFLHEHIQCTSTHQQISSALFLILSDSIQPLLFQYLPSSKPF